jgi:ParB-like chromosome segregation protein Spo0J
MRELKVQYRETDALVPYAGNARTHPEHQVQQICANILRFGFYNPVLVDERGTIIAGHGRVMAAKRLNMDTVPVIVLTGLTDNERRALVLADNRIALNASWDFERVREELSALASEEFDLELTGFSDNEINALLESSADILPADIESHYVPKVETTRTETVREIPYEEPEPQAHTPKVSDDQYSRFDMVMLHTNKAELVEVLSKRRDEMMYEKLEDAMMDLVKHWKENR